jgi:hypothetical protein
LLSLSTLSRIAETRIPGHGLILLAPFAIIARVNTKQRKTLELLFTIPPPTQIPWDDIVSLLQSLGATVKQRAGSRIAISLNGIVAVFHEPHPERKARRLLIRDIRNFLRDAGVQP